MPPRGLCLALLLLASVSLCSAAVGFWCANAPSSPQDRRPNKDQLTVVTYNGEWLFLNSSKCPGSGCPWADSSEAEDHFAAVADVLREIDADIVNVVEVQDCNSLSALNEKIGTSAGYRVYLVQGTDTATGQNVGLLTRIDPIVAVQRYQEGGKDVRAEWPVGGEHCGYGQQGGYTSVSKHYYTRIQLEDSTGAEAGVVTLIGMHFLAFPTDPPRCAQREGQAQVMQALIAAEVAAGRQVIAMGDLNDYDGTVPDANNDQPTSRALAFLKAPGLQSVAARVANAATRYSAWYDKNNDCKLEVPEEVSTIDHILVSAGLSAAISSATYDHSYVKHCDPSNYESDHWPVVVTFDVQALAALRANGTLHA